MKVVVALGGNALGKTPEEQLKLVKQTAKSLAGLIKAGHQVVISHGNGPQVGQINLGLSYAAEHGQGASFPFPECGALSQGYIGYHLQQSLKNALPDKDVATVITQILVNEKDSAFQNPTKPIGSFYSKEDAEKIAKEKGVTFKEDAGRGYRQVIASPLPEKIIELNSIKSLIESGTIVIAGGGGGVPVIKTSDGLKGVPAVIDKDRSSALLADNLSCDTLIILTAVDYVYTNFGKDNQKALTSLSVAEAEKDLADNQFAAGSMKPKVEACLSFVKNHPERKAIITSLSGLDDALAGKLGTVIHN
ncbi:carbamate kinase [Lactobacillus psittaci]|uniref:Carbamate kinase n=1 Tax=Lactobacillus psittaci DSM 15354 TaxID=1122152 RepID=A0A0R1S310_9LACO|nr:carbamate kinase [Lactobacillus psittaci]KRL63033.1 carbamate kinase [Lactobacillus psittaci DSM 15354]